MLAEQKQTLPCGIKLYKRHHLGKGVTGQSKIKPAPCLKNAEN